MAEDEPTMEGLRVELSNLRDDLAVIESSAIFHLLSIGDSKAIVGMRHRIAEKEFVLAHKP